MGSRRCVCQQAIFWYIEVKFVMDLVHCQWRIVLLYESLSCWCLSLLYPDTFCLLLVYFIVVQFQRVPEFGRPFIILQCTPT
ncbi:hypothetical protein K504DRAFT_148202 [Pleomassaria siparia CBS 279.74]|uniref:Uncharacterized protein n=1 Tax=Pleomassaria siparia CBS 279.74 TaxID=1314801 RepID=A0A6G1KLY8_9PLEO|nr:hypothetical protein K504DRAFT_148202 [Pleomassaria siparia CBS 279.74]